MGETIVGRGIGGAGRQGWRWPSVTVLGGSAELGRGVVGVSAELPRSHRFSMDDPVRAGAANGGTDGGSNGGTNRGSDQSRRPELLPKTRVVPGQRAVGGTGGEPDYLEKSQRVSHSRREGGPRQHAARPADAAVAVTACDRHVLALLAEHFTFTTSQLAVLAGFGSLTTARHRLAVLRARGVVHRERPFRAGGGSFEWQWMLGPVGARIVAAESGTVPVRPARIRQRWVKLFHGSRYRELAMQHDWFCHLIATAHAVSGAGELIGWRSAWRISREHRVTTDGYGRWRFPDGRVLEFVLLLDDPPRVRLADRVLKIMSRRYTDPALRAVVVLIWCGTLARAAVLRKRLGRLLDPSPYTALPEDTAAALACGEWADIQPGGPHGRVWIPLGTLTSSGSGRCTLSEITTHAAGLAARDHTRTGTGTVVAGHGPPAVSDFFAAFDGDDDPDDDVPLIVLDGPDTGSGRGWIA